MYDILYVRYQRYKDKENEVKKGVCWKYVGYAALKSIIYLKERISTKWDSNTHSQFTRLDLKSLSWTHYYSNNIIIIELSKQILAIMADCIFYCLYFLEVLSIYCLPQVHTYLLSRFIIIWKSVVVIDFTIPQLRKYLNVLTLMAETERQRSLVLWHS